VPLACEHGLLLGALSNAPKGFWITDARCGSNTLNLPVKKQGRQRLFDGKTINHLDRKSFVNELNA
jgi:hypothetical protein